MKNYIITIATFIMAGFILQSCQTLSKDECAVADWQDLGIKDGRAGHPTSRLEKHTKACLKADIAPDRAAYFAGHNIGIAEFCTPQNGLSFGLRGGYYANSCPANLEPAFINNYRAAFNLKQANDRVARAEATIERVTNQAFNKDLSDEQRTNLRLELAEARLNLKRYQLERQTAQQAYDAAVAKPIALSPPRLSPT